MAQKKYASSYHDKKMAYALKIIPQLYLVSTKKLSIMKKQDGNLKKLGLKKGYYLLLMAILDMPIEEKIKKARKQTIKYPLYRRVLPFGELFTLYFKKIHFRIFQSC